MDEKAGAGASAAGRATGATPSGVSTGRRSTSWRVPVTATVLVLAAVVLVRLFIAEPFQIRSESMAPSLQPGDQVLVNKLAYRGAAPRPGELVVFRAPRTGQVLLKRVVAVGGDLVALRRGVLLVNGRRRAEPYARAARPPRSFGPLLVRPDTVFVLGDNRAASEDSRAFGPVPLGRMIGRVLTRVWPPSRWGAPR